MKARLVDDSAKIYAEPQDQSLTIVTLNKDDEFEMGKVLRKKKDAWVEVILPSGQIGYLPGSTKIFTIKKIITQANNIEIHESADTESQVIKSLPKGSIVTAIAVEHNNEKPWIKIIDSEGTTGFVKGESKIRLYQEPTRNNARKQIITGGIFSIFAVVYYYFTAVIAKSSDNMEILIVVILAFGLIQLVQGIMQMMAVNKIEKEKGSKQP
jgi:hypothetical protein